MVQVVKLLKDRAETLEQLAEGAMLFCGDFARPTQALIDQHLNETARNALRDFAIQASQIPWTREAISALIKTILASHTLKMPQLAIPLRVAVAGTTQTPAIDAVLEILGQQTVLDRLAEI
jgi:glutamyl-tRNA synthetase